MRHTQRKFRPTVNLLETRALLSVVVANDDFGTWTPHDQPVQGFESVLANDLFLNDPIEPPIFVIDEANSLQLGSTQPSATLKTPPTNGTVVLNLDGTYLYTPNPQFVGLDSFTYTASVEGGSSDAVCTISVVNLTPEFEAVQWFHGWGEVAADGYIFYVGQKLGQLSATDFYEFNPLFYSGGGSGIEIQPDGMIVVTNPQLLEDLMTDGGELSFPVFASDGIDQAQSKVEMKQATFLGIELPLGYLDTIEVRFHLRSGLELAPQTGKEVKETLKLSEQNGDHIDLLVIKSHGSEDGTWVGDGYELSDGTFHQDTLTVVINGITGEGVIYIGSTDITATLKALTGPGSTITLRGCNTIGLARKLQAALGNGTVVRGSYTYVLGIPCFPYIWGWTGEGVPE